MSINNRIYWIYTIDDVSTKLAQIKKIYKEANKDIPHFDEYKREVDALIKVNDKYTYYL